VVFARNRRVAGVLFSLVILALSGYRRSIEVVRGLRATLGGRTCDAVQ
jgi:hypothetical protein